MLGADDLGRFGKHSGGAKHAGRSQQRPRAGLAVIPEKNRAAALEAEHKFVDGYGLAFQDVRRAICSSMVRRAAAIVARHALP